MKFKLAIGALLIMSSLCAFAGAKEDFVDAVVKSCGKSKDDAEKMATPGRAGLHAAAGVR